MQVLRADWRRDPEWPERRQLADVEIDGQPCTIELSDSTSYTSGRRYTSLTVHAPYQGRGNPLRLEVNGVEITLDWNGTNRPRFPRRPTSANYRRQRIEGVIDQLRGRPAARPEPEQPSPPAPAGPEVNPLRAVRGTWRRGWRFWVLKIESGVPWIRKVTMKGDTHVRCRGEGGPILNGPVWIGRYPVSFSPHKSGNFFVANVDPETGRSIRAQ